MKRSLVWLGVLLLGLNGAAQSQEMPVRKPGLWEMQMSSSMVGGGVTMLQCIDDKTDAQMQKQALQSNGGNNCTVSSKRLGADWEYLAVCKQEGMTVRSSTRVSGDFQSAYQMDTTTRMEPPPVPGMAEVKTLVKLRHMGACPASMKPGDTTLNGKKL